MKIYPFFFKGHSLYIFPAIAIWKNDFRELYPEYPEMGYISYGIGLYFFKMQLGFTIDKK